MKDAGTSVLVHRVETAQVVHTRKWPALGPQTISNARANAYAERWVGTFRREVLDRMLILGCRQLLAVLAEYADHYNGHHPHRALGQAPPLGPAEPPAVLTTRTILRQDRLGGLIHEYAQVE